MKQYSFILTCLLHLLAGTVWAQSEEGGLVQRGGLGVFGEGLGIHGEDTLVVFGDLVLEQAEVVGEGTLKLRGQRPAKIVAHHSTVRNLHVATATRVTVQGDLSVTSRLKIESGTLDARPGTLTLPTGCKIEINNTGKLFVRKIINVASNHHHPYQLEPQPLDADLTQAQCWPDQGKGRDGIRTEWDKETVWAGRYWEQPTPPPEGRFV